MEAHERKADVGAGLPRPAPIMSFNTVIRVCGGFPTGRYIGGGRDKSGPTGVPRPFTRPLFFRYSSLSALGAVNRPLRLVAYLQLIHTPAFSGNVEREGYPAAHGEDPKNAGRVKKSAPAETSTSIVNQ